MEIQDLKDDKTKLGEKFAKQQKSLVNLEERVTDAERYKRRWCLNLYGLSEQPNEDVKAKVVEICNVVAPESCKKAFEVIDIAHRHCSIHFAICARCHLEECQKQRIPETTQASLRGRSNQRGKGQAIASMATCEEST